MMIETILFLETTPDRFIKRLGDYARENRCQVIIHQDAVILSPPGQEISTAAIPGRKYGSFNMVFVVRDLAPNRVEIEARRGQPKNEDYFRHLLEQISEWWPRESEGLGSAPEESVGPSLDGLRGKPGRPPMHWSERVDRLARAAWGLELEAENPQLQRTEIKLKVGWNYGSTGESSRKLFESAMSDVRFLEQHDPQGLLDKIEEYRGQNGLGR